MKRHLKTGLTIAFVIMAFFLGVRQGQQRQPRSAAPEKQKILYYVDPMNPSHTSDQPGLAPCGMKLEPVYADSSGSGAQREPAPGTVRISPEKQQMIGVSVAEVEKTSWTHRIRTYGRVVADERRVYRINATTEGWIRKVYNATTGSLVMKDEPLAAFYTTEFLTAQQAFMYALDTVKRIKEESPDSEEMEAMVNAQLRSAVEGLQNLGVTDVQIQELSDSSEHAPDVVLRAPTTGFVLLRNASLGQRFEAGAELFQVADLSHIWVIADTYESEAPHFRPGISARIHLPNRGKALQAVVSDILPQYDPSSRTMKVRLELDNPGFILRPDMLVDVEMAVALPPTLTVPADAVLDAGIRKVVFVDLGDGIFEPRRVETGWRMDERIEIIRGLSPGERIVVSGNFLIDSESRMKLAAAGMSGELSGDELRTATTAEPPQVDSLTAEMPRAVFIPRLNSSRKARSSGSSEGMSSEDGMEEGHSAHAGMITGGEEAIPPENEEPSNTRSAAERRPTATDFDSIDPVCHMPVPPGVARATGRMIRHNDQAYVFCSDECKAKFLKKPDYYVNATLPERMSSSVASSSTVSPARVAAPPSARSAAGKSNKKGRHHD